MKRHLSGWLVWFFLLSIGLLFIYGPLLTKDSLLAFDDPYVVSPMANIHSIGQYLDARAQHLVMDVQPVRDLTYVLNYVLLDHFAYGFFHGLNLLLWGTTAVLVRILLLELGFSPLLASAISLLYAFDPIFVGAVAWVSARKHLLSAFFTVLATVFWLKKTKNADDRSPTIVFLAGIFFLYGLACFSQPLNIFWPLFAFIYGAILTGRLPLRRAREWFFWAALLGMAVICAYLNQKYYTTDYGLVSGEKIAKYVDASHDALSWKLLALGRYFFQTLLPLQASVWDHFPGSPFGLLGLCLLPVFVFFAWKKLEKVSIPWMLFFVLSLAPVLLRMTNVFASDTYLLTAAVGIFVLLAYLTDKFLQNSGGAIVAAALVVCFVWKSNALAENWLSDHSLWTAAHTIEATAKNTKEYASVLLQEQEPAQAMQYALLAWDLSPTLMDLPLILSHAIFSNPALSVEEKLHLLQTHPSDWSTYYQAGLLAQAGKFMEAETVLSPLVNAKNSLSSFGEDFETVVAESTYICKRAHQPNCDGISTQMKPRLQYRSWREDSFQARLKSLGN